MWQALFGIKVQGAARTSAGRRENKCRAPLNGYAGFGRLLLTLLLRGAPAASSDPPQGVGLKTAPRASRAAL